MPNSKKETVLIVDDSEMNRMILSEMLGNDYNIIEAVDGLDGIKTIERNLDKISIVLLDLIMPNADGFDVMNYMKQYSLFERMPVVMITSEQSPESIKKAYELGAADYISRPFDMEIVKRRVSNTIFLYAKQRKLSGIIAEQITEKEKIKNLMVGILSHIVEFRNGESGLHVLHISKLTETLLKRLIKMHKDLSYLASDISLISNAAALHDIGKIVIPEKILNKPGKLTKEEFEVIKTHSEIGANIIKSMAVNQQEPMLKYAYEICRWHHERWDGSGYPDGLKGDEIPLSAQIVSLVDVYDALTSKRCYKPAFSHEKAMDIILNEEKGKYNPILIEAFLASVEEVKKIVNITGYTDEDIESTPLEDIQTEIDRYDDLRVYNKGLQIMKIEREKTLFMAETQTNYLFFSYRLSQNIVGVSGKDLDKLGLDTLIVKPDADKNFTNIFGKDFINTLKSLASKTSYNYPDYNFQYKININGEEKLEDIRCHSIYSIDDSTLLTNILFRIER